MRIAHLAARSAAPVCAALAATALLLGASGCHQLGGGSQSTREAPEDPTDSSKSSSHQDAPLKPATTSTAAENAQLDAEIQKLAAGKDPDDEKGEIIHDDAVAALTARGSAIELPIVDAMRGNHDWNVRLGCVEVLQSIGTKACVPHLIAALRDPQPLVAFTANSTLEALTKHGEIPAEGTTRTANGLPPVPIRKPDQLALDTELKIWSIWYRDNGKQLHDSWDQWWKANAERVRID